MLLPILILSFAPVVHPSATADGAALKAQSSLSVSLRASCTRPVRPKQSAANSSLLQALDHQARRLEIVDRTKQQTPSKRNPLRTVLIGAGIGAAAGATVGGLWGAESGEEGAALYAGILFGVIGAATGAAVGGIVELIRK